MKFAGLGVTREMGGEVLGLEDEMLEYDNRVAAAVRTADAEANLLKVEDEISSDQRRKLARGAEDFCLPKEGLPTADALKTAEGRAKLLEILGFNLHHLGEKLGSEALTTYEVKYYATVLKGVLDEKLPRLDEATRNAFLLEIGEDANLRTFFDRLLAA